MPSTMLTQILLARLFELCIYAEYGAYQDELPYANCTIVERNIRRGFYSKKLSLHAPWGFGFPTLQLLNFALPMSSPIGLGISDFATSHFSSQAPWGPEFSALKFWAFTPPVSNPMALDQFTFLSLPTSATNDSRRLTREQR